MHTSRFIPSITAIVITLLLPSLAWADETTDNKIEAQPLVKALAEFADQTGLQLVYPSELATGVDSQGASTDGAPEKTLDQLLASTGLEYEYINDRTIAIRAVSEKGTGEERSDSDPKNSGSPSFLMAQSISSQRSPGVGTGGRSDARATSVVVGKVTDARTGANLKGALITVEETGQSASTNDLGEFRIVGVPVGTQSITVSFLGYAALRTEQVVLPTQTNKLQFALRGGSDMEEIIVFGQRSARAQALNQERSADNTSTVVSSDLLGNLQGTTISEALRRVPGVAFQRDTEATGDGTNVIVRGLEPDLNTVRLNGLRLPEGSGEGRSAELNNILADSVEKITISKTLLPSQDSSGTGGLIDIETKSPLDRPKRHFSIGGEGAWRDNGFRDDLLLTATASRSFGASDNLGLSVSAQYRDRSASSVRYSTSINRQAEYFPLLDGGVLPSRFSQAFIDPSIGFPFEPGVTNLYPSSVQTAVNETKTEDSAVTVSGEWRVDDGTNLRFDYQRSRTDQSRFSRSVLFSQSLGVRNEFVEAVGEERPSVFWRGVAFGSQAYILAPDTESTTDTLSFRGSSDVGRWGYKYEAGFAEGSRTSRNDTNISFSLPSGLITESELLDAATDPREGRIISIIARRQGEGIPFPLINDQGLAIVNDSANYTPSVGTVRSLSGKNKRYSARASTRYNLDLKHVQYVEFGGDYEDSQFRSVRDRDARYGFTGTVSDLGLVFDGGTGLDSIGVSRGFSVPTQGSVQSFVTSLPSSAATPGSGITLTELESDPRQDRTKTVEQELSLYAQGKIEFDRLEIVGGVRWSRVNIRAVDLSSPTIFDVNFQRDLDFESRFATLLDEEATVDEFLPRFTANYRFDKNRILRAGFYRSVARPQIRLLSAERRITLQQAPSFITGLPTLFVNEGNPGLEPATTDNYDLSLELYSDTAGVVKVGAFYKEIDNLLQSNLTISTDLPDGLVLPDDARFEGLTSENTTFLISRPQNSVDTARIWGAELSIERQFTGLSGFWSGLGVYANYTYTDSSVRQSISYGKPTFSESGAFQGVTTEVALFEDINFNQQPEHSGTVSATYSSEHIDGAISYSYQDRRLVTFGRHNLSTYAESDTTLDFRAEYRFKSHGHIRVFIEGTDLLRGTKDAVVPQTIGGTGATPKYFTEGSFFGGRELRMGILANF